MTSTIHKITVGYHNHVKRRYILILGICFVITGWYTLHYFTNDLIIASPLDAGITFTQMLFSREVLAHTAVTLKRYLIGMALGTLLGIALGVVSGLVKGARDFLEPLRWLALSMPPVVIVMLSMLFFGMGDRQCVTVLIVLISPIMYTNTLEGIIALDQKLIEMQRIYKADFKQILVDIYLPGIFSYVNAGLVICIGLGIRIVILSEVLGAHDGIGYKFAMAKLNLQVTELYAWILMCFCLVGVIEFGLLHPIKRYLDRWK